MLVNEFDSAGFRSALGKFATGVAVVTAIAASGEWLGLTVSSFNSVSLSPPLVLFSIAKNARAFEAWKASQTYVVNVLGEHHRDVSNRFGRASVDKWSGIDVDLCDCGPVLADSLVSFHCSAYNRYDGGDHEIFVGQVIAMHRAQELKSAPLVFFAGGYRRLVLEDSDPNA